MAKTLGQQMNVLNITSDIVKDLTPEALNEISKGIYGSDFNKFLEILQEEADLVLNNPVTKLDTSSFGYMDKFSESLEETLRSRSFNYFIASVLPNFTLGWHNLEWSNMIQVHRLLCILASRDSGKSVDTETLTLMYDGSYKMAKDVVKGDKLMGADSTPRIVTNVGYGNTKMYEVKQSRGATYTVNKRHTMCLYSKSRRTTSRNLGYYKTQTPEIVDIDIEDFIGKSDTFKNRHKGYKVCVEFPEKDIAIDPYYLGLWLGDGTADVPSHITNNDKPIKDWIKDFSKKNGWRTRDISKFGIGVFDESSMFFHGNDNPLHELFEIYGLKGNKHIPEDYLVNSVDVRMKLLAGILDTDGYMSDNTMTIAQSIKRKGLIDDIERLCYGLGLHVTRRDRITRCNGKEFPSIELAIRGEKLEEVPFLLERRKVVKKGHRTNSLHNRPKYYNGDNRNYDISNVSTLSIKDVGDGDYVSITVDGDRRFLLHDNTVVHNSYHFDFAYPLWQMYRYRATDPFGRPAPFELKMAREGMLITNEIGLAINFMDMIKTEIKDNPTLADRLLPKSVNTGWGREEIKPKNGSRLMVKSAGSKIRGHHPTWINLDDFPNESSLYSQDARDKLWNMFSAVIFPALSPGGSLNVVGTPFIADLDIYGKIKAISKKDTEEMKKTGVRKETWKIFEYPAIFPDGRILFPQRPMTYESIMQKRDLLGSIIFSREILVRPISDGSTVFPREILNKAIRRSGGIGLLPNIKFAKKKFVKVAIGCDFAMSSSIGSDYSCFTVLGMDEHQNIHLLNSWIDKGKNYKTQLGVLKKMNADFKPDKIVMETNNIGQIMYDMAVAEGLPVVPSVTGIEKKSLRQGIPALAVLFERGKFIFPYADDKAKKVTERYFSELSSMTFIQDKAKFESVGAHDDTAISLWECIKGLYWAEDTFNFSFIGD